MPPGFDEPILNFITLDIGILCFILNIKDLASPSVEVKIDEGLVELRLDLILILMLSKMVERGIMENRISLIVLAATSILGLAANLTIVGCDKSSSTGGAVAAGSGLKSDSEIAQAAMDAEAAEEEISRTRKPASKASKAKSSKESVFLVQVGTFKVEQNATKTLEKLKGAGLPAFQKKIERENGETLFAVRIEPTPNRAEAEKFVASAKEATGQSPMIISVGQ